VRTKSLFSILILLLVTAVSFAQEKSSLSFSDDGDREVWVQSGSGSQVGGRPAADSIKTSKALVNVDLSQKSDSDTVYIADRKTGNLAKIKIANIKKDVLHAVSNQAFQSIAQVDVLLEHSGQPLAAGNVVLDDGHGLRSELLDPSTKGAVSFYDVKPGSLKVTAKFKVKDGSEKSVTQLVEVPLTRTTPVPVLDIAIPGDVLTTGEANSSSTNRIPPESATGTEPSGTTPSNPSSPDGEKATPGSPSEPKGASPANPLGSVVSYLIGLVIVGLIVFIGYRYATQNKDLVQGKLKQLGVDIPTPGTDPIAFDAAAAPKPKVPDPPQKIILSDSAPDPIAPLDPSPVKFPGEPRLVSEHGDAMVLSVGETVVGRDVGLGLSLIGESTVSRKHAQLVRNGNEVAVTDLGSTNGTYINGIALKTTAYLRAGDSVQFGSVRFRFEA
jgi:FHA domain